MCVRVFCVEVSVCKGVLLHLRNPHFLHFFFPFIHLHMLPLSSLPRSAATFVILITVQNIIHTYFLHCLDNKNSITCSCTLSGHPPSSFACVATWPNYQPQILGQQYPSSNQMRQETARCEKDDLELRERKACSSTHMEVS